MKDRTVFLLSTGADLRVVEPKEGEAAGKLALSGKMVFYSGAPVYRYDWWSDTEYMLTLSMDPKHVDLSRMNGAPLLADHYRSVDRQVGVIERAYLEGGKGRAEYRFADTEDTEIIRAKVADGILRQVSMEAQIMETEDVTPKGEKIKQFLATSWQPQAVALVPVGADPGAQMMGEAEAQSLWLPRECYRGRTGSIDFSAGEEPAVEHALPQGAHTSLVLAFMRRENLERRIA